MKNKHSSFPQGALSSVSEDQLHQETKKNSIKKLLESRHVHERGGFDIICELPDPILDHILSFLPTEDVAGITLLSKRLNSLWSSLSVLDLDFRRFSRTYSNSTPEDQKNQFADFVERMIVLHRGRHLDEFRLVVDATLENVLGKNTSLIDNWVLFALTSNSTTVDLRLWGVKDYYKLPTCSSVVQSVTVLRLSGCEFVPMRYKGFESLKTLILSEVVLPEDSYSLNDVLVTCPDLKELHLKQCIVPCYFEFEAPPKSKLESFVLEVGHDGEAITIISIRVPSLLKFRFSGVMIEDFGVHAENLIEANINFEEEIISIESHNMIHGLLWDLRNVTALKICQPFLLVLGTTDPYKAKEGLSTTHYNLRHLSLETCLHGCELKGVADLLRSCPYLESLSIHLSSPWSREGHVSKFWESLVPSLDCLHQLKKIKMKSFVGKSHEMEFLSYVLKNTLVLKEVVISTVVGLKSTYSHLKSDELILLRAAAEKTKEDILALPRASDVQIVFSKTC